MSEVTPACYPGTLDAVCQSVSNLVLAGVGPPRRIQVRAGDVAIEVEWPLTADEGVPGRVATAEMAESGDLAGLHADIHYIAAPMVGTFYQSPEPGAPPFVEKGDLVDRGRQVGILEVMKLMMPVEADCAGRVVEIIAPDGGPVEYGQPLIAVVPLGPD
jgi:acetyl-CoA carboxylase biotin carboxyl carrier protein